MADHRFGVLMQPAAPIVRDLVLLGGGHTHVQVLKTFAMRPVDGLRITLINRDTDTPYSGMLPGLIAGHYTSDETHIDLGRLARFARARFVHDEAIGIEPDKNRLLFSERPPVSYDILSINTGSTPNVADVPGAAEYTVPVKPISNFLSRWEQLCARALASTAAMTFAAAGAGAGGVELLLAAQFRLNRLRAEAGIDAPLTFHIFSGSSEILPGFNDRVRTKFERILRERNIVLHTNSKVTRVAERHLILANGETYDADEILWVTDASAPAWFRKGGLATNEHGFIRVNTSLQSVSHADIFAAGDVAAVEGYPRPKAGVFAVRQGPPLTANLLNALMGKSLTRYSPQKQYLALISTGDKYAIASRNGLALEGAWVWTWKDWIDRRFMAKFNDLPDMQPGALRKPVARLAAPQNSVEPAMRCGGCGAKIGAASLSAGLHNLRPITNGSIIAGLSSPDDAAIVRLPAASGEDRALVHTVDSFRALVDDPYLFGKIAANHGLSDIFAMGATPHTALAIATLPYAAPDKTAADLHQMMAGAIEILNANDTVLVGGHSAEGAELSLGLAINGSIAESLALRKGGLQHGDAIILTKPLGTGTLFAADMVHKARSRWILAALQAMLQSNGPAAQCLRDYDVHACTDVTGFGLAGHLGEMAQASNMCIAINSSAIPVFDGAREMMQAGIVSSLHEQNAQHASLSGAANDLMDPILFDPQTSGGLIAGLPAHRAEACVTALHDLGYRSACVIASASARQLPDGPLLRLDQRAD